MLDEQIVRAGTKELGYRYFSIVVRDAVYVWLREYNAADTLWRYGTLSEEWTPVSYAITSDNQGYEPIAPTSAPEMLQLTEGGDPSSQT